MPSDMRIVVALLIAIALTATDSAQAQAGLNIALEAPIGARVRQAGEVFEEVQSLLTGRGHNVTIVSGTELDTAAEIGAFDLVVLTGTGWDEVDWETFDPQVEPYVSAGGGLVATGFDLHSLKSGHPAAGIEMVLPFAKGTSYIATGGTITVLSGHQITDGLGNFANPSYDNFGGGAKGGATVLTENSAIPGPDSGAWEYGAGRAVYLGPIYMAEHGTYDNEPLLDGSLPDAQQLFINSVEWAGQAPSAATVPGLSLWAALVLAVTFAVLSRRSVRNAFVGSPDRGAIAISRQTPSS